MFYSLDTLAEGLRDIRKNLEKRLISTFVANHSHVAAENRKLIIKENHKTKQADIKADSSIYLTKFTATAKGKWVKEAKQAFNETAKKLEQI